MSAENPAEPSVFALLQAEKRKEELNTLIKENGRTEHYGLSLSEEDARTLMRYRDETLQKYRRVEFGAGILDRLAGQFCDSPYLWQDCYLELLERLTEIFYEFKNASLDRLNDEELLNFMKEQFDGVCFGDPDYLEGTCLDRFAEAVRAGSHGFESTGGRGEYEQLSTEERWDKDLYLQVLKDLGWD